MNQLNLHSSQSWRSASRCLVLVLMASVGLSACGDKEKKGGQALASVGGEEITISQLNDEMQRAGVTPAQQEAASKQLLESLIDRQLLLNAAAQEKLDRDPKVVQNIERAKAMIVAQSYMQKHLQAPAKPSRAEIEDYYTKHPLFFAQRKQLEMRELSIATSDFSTALKTLMDSAKSLEEVAVWLDANKVKFSRLQLSRSSAEMPPELTTKLLAMQKGQLFVVKEGERSLLITIADTRDTPATLEQVAPQIEQLLMNQRSKEAAAAELKRLRAAAKIEYLNKAAGQKPAATPAQPAAASASASGVSSESTERGVAGLK